MKFLSLRVLTDNFLGTLKRFWFPVLLALAGTIAASEALEYNKYNNLQEGNLVKLSLACNIGLCLSLSVTLLAELRRYGKGILYVLYLLIGVACASLYYTLQPPDRDIDFLRFMLIIAASHLLVSFLPFCGKGQRNGFWQYNKMLFLRLCTSALYSFVLFIGLWMALFSASELFDLNIRSKTYGQLFYYIFGLFNTVFFLSGIPRALQGLNEETSYPRGLKVFTQFVLMPLSAIYLCILLAYELKIAIQWKLPQGYVAGLIIGYAIWGIFSLLLVYPLRNDGSNKWIKIYSRGFYFLMIPLLVLFILSIYKRISDYGITEERYLLIIIAVWLSMLTLVSVFYKEYNPRFIPVSLCIACIIAAFGPLSAASVSLRSQQKRLAAYIKDTKNPDRGKELISIISYLKRTHGLKSIQGHVKADLYAIEAHFKKMNISTGADHIEKWEVDNKITDSLYSLLHIDKNVNQDYFNVSFQNRESAVHHVEQALLLVEISSNEMDRTFTLGTDVFELKTEDNYLDVRYGKEKLHFPINELFQHIPFSQLMQTYNHSLPDKSMSMQLMKGNYIFLLKVKHAEAAIDHKNISVNDYNAVLIIRRQESK